MYGQRLKYLRQERGWTQLQLANAISTTASTIGKYEREELQPNIDVITALCKVFDVSADYLLGLEN